MNLKTTFFFVVILLSSSLSFAEKIPPVGCPTITMSGTQVNCYGGNNGSASVAVSGGSGNYTYTWSFGTGPWTNSLTALSVGTYTVNVKDNVSGCTVVGAYVVDQPSPISLLSSFVSNVNCYGTNSGSINIAVTGGKAPYTYLWTNGATSQNISSLSAGTYSVTITDANVSPSCTYTTSFTVTQPATALNSSAIVNPVSCAGGADGSIDVTVWGGTTPYSYSWSNSQLSQDISSLTSGTYTLTVNDAKGCSLSGTSYNVDQPAPLSGVISSTDVTCFGTSTGSATFNVTGGTLPYSYSWQNTEMLFSSNTAILSGIPANNYSVTATDSKGCTTNGNVVVVQPSLLTATATSTNVLCYGNSTGYIDLAVNGGTAPYSFSWQNNASVVIATTEDVSNLSAGTYTVTVTDNKGCTVSLSKTITQPSAPLSATFVVSHVLCYGNSTGSINLTVEGGTTPYSYSWTSSQTTEDINFVSAGNYGFAILDANLCPFSGSATVNQPLAPISVSNIVTNVACNGESNGSIDLTVAGGTSPYYYTWESTTYELSVISQDLFNFPADTYTYNLTDAYGCTYSESIEITEPLLLENTISGVNILCYQGNNGSVDLTVTGGTLPYTFNWNNGVTSEDLINLIAGTYSVVVTDFQGCETTNSITLTQPDTSLYYSYSTMDVKCNNGTDGFIALTVEGGTTPYTYNWSNGATQPTVSGLTASVYTFNVIDYNGCTLSASIEIFQPDPLTMNEVITPVTCYGMSNGIIDISPIGGTTPYQFTWYNSNFALSAQTEDLVDWPADVYQVEIIDSNNCFYEMFFEIEQPDSLIITYTATVVSCNGGSDSDILVEITGGNPPYNTTWSNGATTQDLIGVSAGTYELIVVDSKGCTDSIETTITEPLPISMTFEVTEITCIDQKDGTALATAFGGNGGYYYAWSNGLTNSYVDSLDNQYYSLTITDVLGCTGLDSVFIPRSNALCVEPVSAFTPNGDNYNDTWIIDNMYLYPDAEMKIFDRWGTLIYEQKGIYEPWNGQYNGAEVPSEVYYYILNLNFPERDPLYGNITIVR